MKRPGFPKQVQVCDSTWALYEVVPDPEAMRRAIEAAQREGYGSASIRVQPVKLALVR